MKKKKPTKITKPKRRGVFNKHARLLLLNRHRYEEILAKQGGVCALCGRPPKTRRLDMDHDHKRMVIRGLLCHRCNRSLPSWIDREWLLRAAEYVDREA